MLLQAGSRRAGAEISVSHVVFQSPPRFALGDFLLLIVRFCALVFERKQRYVICTMIDLVKKTMLAGVGLAVVTKDKVLESLDELVEKGRLTKEEAAEMSDRIVNEGKVETEKAKVEASRLFTEMLQRANVVTKDQYDALVARVTELEGRLHKEFPNND